MPDRQKNRKLQQREINLALLRRKAVEREGKTNSIALES